MTKIRLYIAMSMDGYIARKDGTLDWLEGHPNPDQLDYGYKEFMASIEAVIMGRKTYEEILGFDIPWPHANATTYVVTAADPYKISTVKTEQLTTVSSEVFGQIRSRHKKDIWLVGGGQLVTSFLNHDLIDEMTIFSVPTIIGDGLPLFPDRPKETRFELIHFQAYATGITKAEYRRIPLHPGLCIGISS